MLKIIKEITLPINDVLMWRIINDNFYVSKYMGCNLRRLNQEKVEWYFVKENQEVILLYGDILEEEINHLIRIRTFNPHRNYDRPYYLTVSYELSTDQKTTTLRIEQWGFEELPDGEIVYQENQKGFDFMLENIQVLFADGILF